MRSRQAECEFGVAFQQLHRQPDQVVEIDRVECRQARLVARVQRRGFAFAHAIARRRAPAAATGRRSWRARSATARPAPHRAWRRGSRSLSCVALSSLSKIEKPRRSPALACSICSSFRPSAWKVQMVRPSRRVAADALADALAHFLRRLVGEGDRGDALGRIAPGRDQVRDLLDDHARLAAAGAGEHQQRAVAVRDRGGLWGVEAVHRSILCRAASLQAGQRRLRPLASMQWRRSGDDYRCARYMLAVARPVAACMRRCDAEKAAAAAAILPRIRPCCAAGFLDWHPDLRFRLRRREGPGTPGRRGGVARTSSAPPTTRTSLRRRWSRRCCGTGRAPRADRRAGLCLDGSRGRTRLCRCSCGLRERYWHATGQRRNARVRSTRAGTVYARYGDCRRKAADRLAAAPRPHPGHGQPHRFRRQPEDVCSRPDRYLARSTATSSTMRSSGMRTSTSNGRMRCGRTRASAR